MTDRRGGRRVPDGTPRPSSLPFARGPNRSDLSQVPGTPGTELPPSPAEPSIQHGQAGNLRRMLQGIPIDQVSPQTGLTDGTQRPDEPLTAGVGLGEGVGPEGLFPSPGQLDEQMTADELKYIYPLLYRLATLPNATTETKILAQRVRAHLPLQPEQLPQFAIEPEEMPDGVPGADQTGS